MAKALPWTPWHEVVRLREDLRAGDLPLASFAADLYTKDFTPVRL